MQKQSKIRVTKGLYIFSIFVLINLVLRFLAVANYHFAFTWDQARDLIDLRRLVFGHHPLLVGPTTGLTGVFLGPFWYYLNAPLYWIMKGNPLSLIITQILVFLYAGFFIFGYFNKHYPFNLIFSLLFIFSPLYFHTTHYSLNPNILPAFFLLVFSILPDLNNQTKQLSFLLFGLLLGLALQIEAAMAVMFIPFALIYLLLKHSSGKKLVLSFIGILITLIPQIMYELVHHFSMTRLVLNQVLGQQDYITNKLSFYSKIIDLTNNYKQSLLFTFQVPWYLSASALVLSVLFLFYQYHSIPQQLRTIFKLFLVFYPASFFFYLFYPFRIYLWYIHSFGVIYLFIFSLVIYLLKKQYTVMRSFGVILFLFISIRGLSWQLHYIKQNNKPSTNSSNLANRLTIIDWIYQKANGQGFEVYTYSPAVYDLQTNYSFWWYGHKFGYYPNIVSFQKDSSHYLNDNQIYWKKSSTQKPSEFVFLILEEGNHPLYKKEDWQKQFENLCFQEKKSFDFAIQVDTYLTCTN